MKRYKLGEKCVVMSREEVRSVDAWAINKLGIAGAVLMENAGRSCAEFVLGKLSDKVKPKVCIFCGTGNNGGDGFVAARHLRNLQQRIEVVVVICGQREKIGGDAKTNLDILDRLGQPVEVLDINNPEIGRQVRDFAGDAGLIVDGLFGTGLKGEVSEPYRRLIEGINALTSARAVEPKKNVLAIDIPSGLDCDTGVPLGAAIKADWTVTFVALKKGFLAKEAANYTGEIFIASIGVEPDGWCLAD
jgi:NAD(P)H-hydrate epimerase